MARELRLGDEVAIRSSGEEGEIVTVSTFLHRSTIYTVEIVDGDGPPYSEDFTRERLKLVDSSYDFMSPDFNLGQRVTLHGSGETGDIIGITQSLHGEDEYLLRYISAGGALTEEWWGRSAIYGRADAPASARAALRAVG